MTTSSHQDIARYELVRRMFRDTADQNYIAARWCFLNGLNVDFYWLALHSIEKYLKTILLLNGKAAGHGHDIVKLYSEILPLTSGLLLENFRRPPTHDVNWWHEDLPDTFIHRLNNEGHSENRYATFGSRRWYDDIFKVDQIIFALRRICHPLDVYA